MSESEAPSDPDSTPNNGGIAGQLRRWRRTDDLDGLRMRIQRALRTAEEVMYSEHVDAKTRLKAAHAVVTAAREARKMIETHELEQRLERVEKALEARAPHRQN